VRRSERSEPPGDGSGDVLRIFLVGERSFRASMGDGLMTAGAPNNESLQLSAEMRIDAVCTRFEAAWQAVKGGDPAPRIEDYLPAVEEAERWPLLRELLLLELNYRQGEVCAAEEYGRRFPAYAERIAPLLRESAPEEQGQPAAKAADRDANDTPRERPVRGQIPARGALPSIPGYEIVGELGRGGMGVVYEARHLALDRPVALKMIRSGADAGEEELARFRTEAEAAARLQHPNIVQIHEVGEHQGLPYVALEFCPGGSLEKKLNGTPLPPQPAAQLAETLARAMHVAHGKGIVHRDLKPANVLLVASERPEAVALADGAGEAERYDPKITDFGLAKRLDVDVGQTQTGAILGTPSYMAPEQACGKSKEIGPAADVYALGATLYELLTGRPPFKAATPLDTILQVIGEDPVPPRTLQPKLPRDLETVCLKCLQKEPSRRYGSAQELADDLRRFQEGKPILARPVGRLEKAAKWARRRPAAAALVAVSSLGSLLITTGLVVGILVIADAWDRERGTRNNLEIAVEGEKHATAAANEQTEIAKKATADANNALEGQKQATAEAGQQLNRARHNAMNLQLERVLAVYERDPRLGRDLLDDTEACPIDLRDFAWGLYYRWCQRDRFRVTGASVACSLDGKTLSSVVGHPAEDSGGVYDCVMLWDVAEQRGRLAFRFTGVGEGPMAFSPDGKRIILCRRGEAIKIRDVATGTEQVTLAGDLEAVSTLEFSKDGRILALASENWKAGPPAPPSGGGSGSSVALASNQGKVTLWETASGRQLGSFQGENGRLSSLLFSPDGTSLVILGGDGAVTLWDVATRKKFADLEGGRPPVVFTSDGHLLASGSRNNTVLLWDGATGKALRSLPGHAGAVSALAFSADGQTLASGSADNTVRVWDAASGKELHMLEGHPGPVTAVAFNATGKLLATGSVHMTVKLWDNLAGLELATLQGGDYLRPIHHVMFVTDSNTLISSTENEAILWDVSPGQATRILKGHCGLVTSVAFTVDGKTLASGSHDHTIRLWEPGSGRLRAQLKGHADAVLSVAFTAAGRTLASGSADGTVKLWDVAAGTEQQTFRGHAGPVTSVVFSPDGRILASGSGDNTVKLWDAATGRLTVPLTGHSDEVTSLVFSADGRTLASGSADKTVKLWDVARGKEVGSLRGHAGAVTSVTFSRDGHTLASASGGRDGEEKWFGEVKLWDVSTRQERATLRGHTAFVHCVAFTPDGRTLASASGDATIRLWDALTGQSRAILKGHAGGVLSLAFTGDGRTLASASGGRDDRRESFGEIRLWEVAGRPERATLRGHSGAVFSLAFAADGKTLASSGADNTVRLWDTATGQQRAALTGHDSPVTSLAFAADGQTLATEGQDQLVKLWDVATHEQRGVLKAPAGHALALYGGDGKTLAIVSSDGIEDPDAERTVKLWDARAGEERASFKGAWPVAFSADGNVFAYRDSHRVPDSHLTLRLWDVRAAKELRQIADKSVYSWWPTAFSANGKVLALPSDGVTLWDVATGSKLSGGDRSVPSLPTSLALTRDGKILAAAWGSFVELRDVATGREMAAFVGHADQVLALAFSGDGKTLASGSADHTVRLWDVQPLQSLLGAAATAP
jgi:WD40 repeat protein